MPKHLAAMITNNNLMLLTINKKLINILKKNKNNIYNIKKPVFLLLKIYTCI